MAESMFCKSFNDYADLGHEQAPICLQYAILTRILWNDDDFLDDFFMSMKENFYRIDPTIRKFKDLEMKFLSNEVEQVEDHEIFKIEEFKRFKEKVIQNMHRNIQLRD